MLALRCRRLREEKHTEKNAGTGKKIAPPAGNDGDQLNATKAGTEVGSAESETEIENENCASVITDEDRGLDRLTEKEVAISLHYHLHPDVYKRNLF